MRFSRTGLTCQLHIKAYGTYCLGDTFGFGATLPYSLIIQTQSNKLIPTPHYPSKAFPRGMHHASLWGLSAFALAYIFLLRSCSLRTFLSLSPTSLLLEELLTVGRLCSTGITPLHHYYTPIRHPLVFEPFPNIAGYRLYLPPMDFSSGPGGLLQLLSISYDIMSSLSPRRSC